MKSGLTSVADMLVGQKVRLWNVWLIRKFYFSVKGVPHSLGAEPKGELASILGSLAFGLHGLCNPWLVLPSSEGPRVGLLLWLWTVAFSVKLMSCSVSSTGLWSGESGADTRNRGVLGAEVVPMLEFSIFGTVMGKRGVKGLYTSLLVNRRVI